MSALSGKRKTFVEVFPMQEDDKSVTEKTNNKKIWFNIKFPVAYSVKSGITSLPGFRVPADVFSHYLGDVT